MNIITAMYRPNTEENPGKVRGQAAMRLLQRRTRSPSKAYSRSSEQLIATPTHRHHDNADARQPPFFSLSNASHLELGIFNSLPDLPCASSVYCASDCRSLPTGNQPEQSVSQYCQESNIQVIAQTADATLSQLYPHVVPSIPEDNIPGSSNHWCNDEATEGPADILPPQAARIDLTSRSDPTLQPQFRTIGQKAVICTYNNCGAQFTRRSDLRRHHNSVHLEAKTFFCGFNGCARAANGVGFSRKDKRNIHEKKIHGAKHSA
jgi:hypothetical protein